MMPGNRGNAAVPIPALQATSLRRQMRLLDLICEVFFYAWLLNGRETL